MLTLNRKVSLIDVLLSVLALSFLLASVPVSAGWVCEPILGDPESCQWVYERDYHQVLYDAPGDWCLYDAGDEVWIHHATVNGQWTAVTWYIKPAAQSGNGQPNQCCESGPYYVSAPSGGSCSLFMGWLRDNRPEER